MIYTAEVQTYYTNDIDAKIVTDAIRERGGTTEQLQYPEGWANAILAIPSGGTPITEPLNVTENGTYTAPTGTDGYNPVDVNVQPKLEMGNFTENGTYEPTIGKDGFSQVVVNVDGGGEEKGRVIFVDYDGTVVETWENKNVASKSELPSAPAHSGLIGQGWNWDLQHIKEYVDAYENAFVVVGQMYKTSSGLTEIDITLTKSTGLDVTCNMVGNKNWGDGTADDLTTHTYQQYGDFTITCDGTELPSGTSNNAGMFGNSLLTVANYNYYCTAIRIGENVTTIGNKSLASCASIETITIPQGVTSGFYFHECFALVSITIPNGATTIISHAFDTCFRASYISIPQSITTLESYAIYGCSNIYYATIPQGVTSLESYAFGNDYALQSIVIPEGVTSVGNYAFLNCFCLKSVSIPQGVTTIGTNAFQYCYNLKSVTLPQGLTSIKNYAFQYACLDSVEIPSGVTTIGTNAFQYCYNLKSVTLPQGLTSVGNYAFNMCRSLQSIVIPEGVTSIGNYAFTECRALKNIIIPDSVTNIGQHSFEYCCILESINLPDNMTTITANVLSECRGLTKIVAPRELTSIGGSAFLNCRNIIEYDFSKCSSVPTISSKTMFDGGNYRRKILVPAELYESWIATRYWSDLTNYIYPITP